MQLKTEAMESDLRRAHQSHLTVQPPIITYPNLPVITIVIAFSSHIQKELRKKYSAVELELAELKRSNKAAETQVGVNLT